MSLPTVACPACNARMSLDAWLGHQGAREALLALATLHSSQRLQMAAMKYACLFAPPKREMSLDKMAVRLRELAELIAPARVEWKGASYAAPLDYWIGAMEDMWARRDTLDLPMESHGYLKSMVAGTAERLAAQAERAREDQAAGRTPVGTPAAAPVGAASGREPAPAPAPAPRFRPTTNDFQTLRDTMKGVVPVAPSTPEDSA
jgi:hypothetical protein